MLKIIALISFLALCIHDEWSANSIIYGGVLVGAVYGLIKELTTDHLKKYK